MRSVGILTSVLMVIPMLAIPLLAVFGIPEFITVSASPTATSNQFASGGFTERRVLQSDTVLSRNFQLEPSRQVDLFAPQGIHSSSSSTTSTDRLVANWQDPLRGIPIHRKKPLQGIELPIPSDKSLSRHLESDAIVDIRQSASNRNSTGVGSVTTVGHGVRRAGPSTATEHSEASDAVRYQRRSTNSDRRNQSQPIRPTLTWGRAARILEQMGIRKYQLSAGRQLGEFEFTCSVTSPDDPRISREFRAASNEPLRAVESVLIQVNNWMRR